MLRRKWAKQERLPDPSGTHGIIRLLIQVGYILATTPIFWNNSTDTVGISTSKLVKYRWIGTVSFITLVKVACILTLVMDTATVGFDIRKLDDIWRFFICLCSITTAGFDWYTVWDIHSLVSVINNCHHYYVQFMELYHRTDIPNKPNLASKCLKITFFVLSFIILGSPIIYIFKCHLHILTPVLPVCRDEPVILLNGLYTSHHYSIKWTMLMCIAQLLACTYLCCSVLIYVVMVVPMIFIGLDMMHEQTASDEKAQTIPLLREHEHWARNYNCCRILCIHLDACLGQFIMPFILVTLMMWNILILYVAISVPVGLVIQMFGVGLQMLLLIYFLTAIRAGSLFTELSEGILASRLGMCHSKYLKIHHKSLRPLYMSIGSVAKLNKLTLLTVMESIVDNTVSLVLI